MNELTDATRAQLETFLPDALSQALKSYREFFDRDDSDFDDDGNVIKINAKDFKARHDAAKVALAHVELLLKLHKDLNPSSEKEEGKDQITAMKEALKEIDEQKKQKPTGVKRNE